MRDLLIDYWLYCHCQFMRIKSPSDYMIQRIHDAVSLLDDDDVISLIVDIEPGKQVFTV